MTTCYEVTGAPYQTHIKGIPSREQLFDALRLGAEAGGLNGFGLRLKTADQERDRPVLYVSLEGVHRIQNDKNSWFFWAKINQLSPGIHPDVRPIDPDLHKAKFVFGKVNTKTRACTIKVSPTSLFHAPDLSIID